MFIVYDILFLVFFLLYLPRLIFDSLFRGKRRPGIIRRLGFFSPDFLRGLGDEKAIWLHAVSVGEVKSAAPLLKALRENFPRHRVIVSTVTVTGNEVARKLTQGGELVTYFPLDLSFVIRRILNRINLDALLIVETEIWPNIISACSRRRIPVVFLNARISRASFRWYRLVRPLLGRLLKHVSLFAAQTETDARRLIRLGASPEKVVVTGNIKFDRGGEIKVLPGEEERFRATLGVSADDKFFITGSTHPGEEKIVLRVYRQLIRKFPALRLLIAPRHPERTPEIEKLIAGEGLRSVRFSGIKSAGGWGEKRIVILDTVGQLSRLYLLGTVVFVGGSLVSAGGHNPIEPARFRKAIIFGPHTFNFQEISELFLARGAARRVEDARGLAEETERLLGSPSARKELGEKAFTVVNELEGATGRNIALLTKLLKVE